MRPVTGVDVTFSRERGRCRECGRLQGQAHAADCQRGAQAEIPHLYQRRGFGGPSGAPWSALPSEMDAWAAQPWWRKLQGAERHFRRLGRGIDQRSRARPSGNSRTGLR